jgi:hypothetical protein
LTALTALPAWIIPVIQEDQVARAVQVARADPADPEVDRVAPAAPAGARADLGVDRVAPAGLGVARVVPAGTSDPAVSACGLPGINN